MASRSSLLSHVIYPLHILWCLTITSVTIGAVDQIDDPAALCGSVIPKLRDSLASLDSQLVTYACYLYTPRTDEPAHFDLPAEAATWDRLTSVTVASVYRSGSAYRIHEHTVWSRNSNDTGRQVTFTSDGYEFHARFANAGTAANIMLDLRDGVHRASAQMDAYGWRVLGQVAPVDYSYFVGIGALSPDLKVVHADGDRRSLSWTCQPDAPQTRFTATIHSRTHTLEGICMEVCSADANLPGATISLRKTVEFVDHVLGGRTVRGARVSDQLGDAGQDYPPTWAMTVIIPIAVHSVPCSADMVYLRPGPVDIVQDTRLDLAYAPPDTRVNLDGRLVRLQTQPAGDIGWDLDHWVKELPALSEQANPRDGVAVHAHRAGSADRTNTFDAGSVLTGDAPATVTHKFVVRNDSPVPRKVAQLVKSCGCLSCDISTMSIAPGEEAVLSVAMAVPSPGHREQEVTVVYDDLSYEKYVLRAHGYLIGALRVLSSGFVRCEDNWEAQIRAYWIESDPTVLRRGESDLTLKDDWATLEFDGWEVVEPASSDGLRPRRLFGRGKVTLSSKVRPGDARTGTGLRFAVGDDRACTAAMLLLEGDAGWRFLTRDTD